MSITVWGVHSGSDGIRFVNRLLKILWAILRVPIAVVALVSGVVTISLALGGDPKSWWRRQVRLLWTDRYPVLQLWILIVGLVLALVVVVFQAVALHGRPAVGLNRDRKFFDRIIDYLPPNSPALTVMKTHHFGASVNAECVLQIAELPDHFAYPTDVFDDRRLASAWVNFGEACVAFSIESANLLHGPANGRVLSVFPERMKL